ncbi:hypothetical protein Y032_0382g367 [Ancylostoma ceylanicum]|uniref:Uncharacterized protein n=1 Tax=Ancylostoma ceylanicum TaxID=53326 RepID=A0A016RTQ6_9BILA|nr:hypothetical protein Y032_0382g367 [Ancylostoma ceylanicum]
MILQIVKWLCVEVHYFRITERKVAADRCTNDGVTHRYWTDVLRELKQDLMASQDVMCIFGYHARNPSIFRRIAASSFTVMLKMFTHTDVRFDLDKEV